MKRLMLFTLTGALLAAFTSNASAGDKDHGKRHAVSRYDQRSNSRNHDARDRYDDRHEHVYVERSRYFGTRDVVVVRNYYRPYYRPLPPGVRRVYVRNGYLPYGYSRGIIDGQIVVHNQRGLIVDVAVLF